MTAATAVPYRITRSVGHSLFIKWFKVFPVTYNLDLSHFFNDFDLSFSLNIKIITLELLDF